MNELVVVNLGLSVNYWYFGKLES